MEKETNNAKITDAEAALIALIIINAFFMGIFVGKVML